MANISDILYFDLNYPGVEISVELSVISEYLDQIDKAVDEVCKEYLDKEIEKYKGVPHYEYQHIYMIAEDELPRIIRNPYVVAIYTVLESSLFKLVKYAQEKEGKSLGLNEIRAASLLSKANKYIENILLFDFSFTQEHFRSIAELNKVRNCIVHANGDIDSLDSTKMKEIKDLCSRNVGIYLFNSQIGVTNEYLKNSFKVVNLLLRELMSYIENRYFAKDT